MPIPRIAIVGRPNVGKSSLLNMMAGDKVSIVDPTAGTTRDRVSVIVELTPPDQGPDSREKITAEVTDTGGFGVYVTEGARYNEVGADLATLTGDIEHQISQAVRSADVVLLVIDAQKGVTPMDEHVARLLRERVLGEKGTRAAGQRRNARTTRGTARSEAPIRRARSSDDAGTVEAPEADGPDAAGPEAPPRNVKVLVVANKCDGPKWEAHAVEAANLGFGEPLPVSARTNYFRRDFLDAVYTACRGVPGVVLGKPTDLDTPEMKLAIIGKRNAGKSSLVNALAGEERVIVSEIAGTTRDAVDVRFEMDGKAFIAIDTAGLRKKKSFQDRIEWYALDRAKRAVERADVVLLLVDATEPVSQVDQQLAMIAQKSYKPVLIVVNKWDLAEGRPAKGLGPKHRGQGVTPEMYEEYLRKEFKGIPFAPMAFTSAKDGSNLLGAVRVAFELHHQAIKRVSTGKLNRLLKDILATRGPSSKLGTFAKAYFIAQVAVDPPTIALVVNKPELFTPNYKRFLLNRIRENVPYSEVPIKLLVKGRTRAKPEDLVEGERQRLREEGAAVVTEEGRVEARRRVERPLGADEDFSDAPDVPAGARMDDLDDLPDDAEAYFDDEVEGAEEGEAEDANEQEPDEQDE